MSESDTDIDGFFSTARVNAREGSVELGRESFREFLYEHDDPALAPWRGMNYEEFAAARQNNEFLRKLLDDWRSLYDEPFQGITSDGVARDGLYQLPDTGSADPALVAAARRLVEAVDDDQRSRLIYAVDAPEWRAWSNPEFVFFRVGLRLEDLRDELVDAVHEVLRSAFSPEGYARVREAMELNGFLGELVDLPTVMNDRSYWFALFGEPSIDEPWGFQIFGHHLAVNFMTVGGREVIAPVFIGAEPALSDEARPPIFDDREQLALRLAGSLTEEQKKKAVVFASVLDPSMPDGRLHPADERHVAGAFRDNRVIPYEGIVASQLDEGQRALLREIVEDFHLLLALPERAATLAEFDAHLHETYFSWYGATDGSEPVYLRVHSPVLLAELDNHAGVWLSNRLPARFHVHSTLRLPNGNDYGRAYLEQWRRRAQS